MDAFSAQDNCQTGESLSPKKPVSESKDEFVSESSCVEPVEQKHEMAEDVGKVLIEAKSDSGPITIEQLRLPEDLTESSNCEQLEVAADFIESSSCEPFGASPVDVGVNSCFKEMGILAEHVTDKNSSPKKTIFEPTHEFGSECGQNEPLKHKQMICTEEVAKEPMSTGMKESELVDLEVVRFSEDASCEPLGPLSGDLSIKSSASQLQLPTAYAVVNSNLQELRPPTDGMYKNSNLGQSGQTLDEANKNSSQPEHGGAGTSAQSRKRKTMLKSSVCSNIVLRARSHEKYKAPEASNVVAEDSANREKQRKKRKKEMKKKPVNEFSRLRNNLRYLLHRMQYEQNLIEAYSTEGWKGLSLEKIKPEKELQRAKSEIFRCKLKIRDLFQRLDLSCAEGKLPESLFDSDGQIDSEDIFCAKCGSEDLMLDNDIILCDGACERGFHQLCLDPPLLKEDIPPDDEGWLCPGCDCKVDCIELLNDSHGTNLSITDSWEKVFPEAANGNKLEDNHGSSDDSEDDEYNPDGPEVNEKFQGDDSSSDESDFSSASDDMVNSQNDNQFLGLPSDDSDDDDFNPDAPDVDEQVNLESSSSDFTSDSEDFSVALDDNKSPGIRPTPSSSNNVRPCTEANGERSKLGGMKRLSLSNEPSYLLESAPAPQSGKRHVERLDYKKLHDETYGSVSSQSSDEEYEDDAASPTNRKTKSEKIASVSPNGRTRIAKGTTAKGMKHNQQKNEEITKRTNKKLDVKCAESSLAKSQKVSSELGSSGHSAARPCHRKLGEAATQRLFQSFKENQYPDRGSKENIAKELGLTLPQVNKWFENARHSSRVKSSLPESDPNSGLPQKNKKQMEPEPKTPTKDAAHSGLEIKELSGASPGDVRAGNLVSKGASARRSVTPKSSKRKNKMELQASDHNSSSEEVPDQTVQGNSPMRRSRRIQTRTRKSVG